MEPADNRELLMSYTVFHIGVYITLAAAILAAQELRSTLAHPVMRVSMAAFIIAGICGAVIASNLPDSKSWEDYSAKRLGPWGLRIAPYSAWATLEHVSFWIGVVVPAVMSILWPGSLSGPSQ